MKGDSSAISIMGYTVGVPKFLFVQALTRFSISPLKCILCVILVAVSSFGASCG